MTSPSFLNFNHTYTETVYLDANIVQPEAFRVITRDGVYAPAEGFGSGVTFFERYGVRNLSFLGMGVDPAITVPNLLTAVSYPDGGTAVLAGAILKDGTTNTYYSVPANVTLDATGTTLADRIANDIAAGNVLEVPQNLIRNNLNSSSTPYAPGVLGHQRIIPMCTDGIAIVEIATIASATAAGVTAAATLSKDTPLIVADDEGRVGTPDAGVTGEDIIGRCLDNITVPAAAINFGVPAGYVRIKLGSI